MMVWVLCVAVFLPPHRCLTGELAAEDIRRSIHDLGAAEFQQREKATRSLWEAGKAAETALQDAAQSRDPEVSFRARKLLEKLRWNVHPDTPPEFEPLLRQFWEGDEEAQRAALTRLVSEGERAHGTVVELAGMAARDENHKHVLQALGSTLEDSVDRLTEGRYWEVDMVWRLKVAGVKDPSEKSYEVRSLDSNILNFVAHCLVSGTGEQHRRKIEEMSKRDPNSLATRALAYLCRGMGDAVGAVAAASQSGDDYLEDGMLANAGNWTRLSDKYAEATDLSDDIDRLGMTAVWHRKAGRPEPFQKAIQQMIALQQRGTNSLWPHQDFAVNDLPDEASLSYVREGYLTWASELLQCQWRFNDAFALSKPSRAGSDDERFASELQTACLLRETGEVERAHSEFSRLMATDIVRTNMSFQCDLLGVLGRSREKEMALEMLKRSWKQDASINLEYVKALARGLHARQLSRPRIMHGDGEETAWACDWWRFHQSMDDKVDKDEAASRTWKWMERRPTGAELAALVNAMSEKSVRIPEEVRRTVWRLVGRACEDDHREDLALKLYQQMGHDGSVLEGNLFARRAKWAEAAAGYRKADANNAPAMYLQGVVLTKSGDAESGRKLMSQAQLLAGASEEWYLGMADKLDDARLPQEAAALDRFRAVTRPLFTAMFEVPSREINRRESPTEGFFVRAAMYENGLLGAIPHYQVGFFNPSEQCLLAPRHVHWLRLMGFLQKEDMDSALSEARVCQSFLPGDIHVAHELLPALEARGRRGEADRFFQDVSGFLDKLCADFPKFATAHNDLASLEADAGRKLDDALLHARKATELEPDRAEFWATLAEVCHRRGERDAALTAITKSVDLDRSNGGYETQLKRYQKEKKASGPN